MGAEVREMALWVASFDSPEAPGLSPGLSRWTAAAGESVEQTAHLPLPRGFFLARHPSAPVLYVCDLESEGTIHAVADRGAEPVVLSRRPSGGEAPCHLTVHPDGGWLYVAHYSDGSVVAHALAADGDITTETVHLAFEGSSIDPQRQEASHPHATTVSPDGGFLVVADLGADVLRSYRLDSGRPEGEPVLTTLPAGAGPRHLAWHGQRLYIVGELNGAIITVDWDESSGGGQVRASVPATSRSDEEEFFLSDILVQDGRVIVTARGCDTISVLEPNGRGGLDLVQEVPTATWPTGLAFQSGRVYVTGTHDHVIAAHDLDDDGRLSEVRTVCQVMAPMSVLAGA